MSNNCIGPTNIVSNDNQVILQDVNQTITIVNNDCCTNINVTQPITNVIEIRTPGIPGPQGPSGSNGIPGGLDTYIQYNSGNNFVGSSNFIFDYNTNQVVLTGSLITSGSNTFIGDQIITGSVIVTGSVTADNLMYRWTAYNVNLSARGTHEIIPATPNYRFVPIFLYSESLLGTIEEAMGSTYSGASFTIGIDSNIALILSAPYKDNGNAYEVGILQKGNLSPVTSIDISTEAIKAYINGGTGTVNITLFGYLRRII